MEAQKVDIMKGLCFRCEHRASFNENGSRPRYECGVVNSAVCSCYMYMPVKPVITKVLDKNDKRPRFAGVLSTRETMVGIVDDFVLDVVESTGEAILYWAPEKKVLKK